MPREPSFSKSEVLDRLTDAFVTHGYAGTSLTVLKEATGLGSQSLYNAFGDKQSMYLQAIDCAARRSAPGIAAMQRAVDGRAAIAAYFAVIVECCASTDPALRNCIGTNGLLEGLDEAPLVWALTTRWQSNHELLRSTVERGQRDGSIVSATPSADLAEVLTSLTSGLRVAARVGRSQDQMERLVQLTLSVLDMS